MGKILFWIIAIAIGFAIYRLLQIMERKSARARESQPAPDAPKELILQCAQCAIHVPASEVIRDGDQVFCSQACRDAHRRAGT